MKKFYDDPSMEVRNYLLPVKDIIMTSDSGNGEGGDNNLEDGDDFFD